MKAISVASAGADLTLIDAPIPEPEDTQILVKILYTAINPVDQFMQAFGVLVEEWPLVAGCDPAGVVVKAGSKAISPLGKPFKEGDLVCGCTRLGKSRFGTYQEYNIMDAALTVPVPANLTVQQACTVGVASYTAAVSIFEHLNVPVPDPKNLPAAKNEWALVLGGGSSVGKMAIQILKLCGYRVIVTASPRSMEMMKAIGVDEIVDYKQSEEAIIAEIVKKTDGNMFRIFDAVAQNLKFSVPMFKQIKGTEKWFCSTNDWDPQPDTEDFHNEPVALGPLGRPGADKLNAVIAKFLPFLVAMLEQGKIVPSEYMEVGSGVEAIPEAYEFQKAGKGGNKKVIVKIQDA